ncbi:MAG: MBL fold metallo-hydrolase [Bacteroidetes bacterium]|nr:MBL fold metallo-hydrolase [Bacteroidota bacterium]
MANLERALSENVEGNFFVDSSCINCGVSRHYAPELFGDTGRYSFVKKQPQNEREVLEAQQALLACPVASIGTKEKLNLTSAIDSFPIRMAEGVYLNGFNHRNSYGAHSYFVKSDKGNWLIDSPRFIPHLVKKFEEMGGIRYIFLSHRDDVCDAERYAGHFGSTRIIHQLELDAQPDAEMVLEGEETQRIDSAEIHFTPGHTQGHLVMLWNKKYLFTGDHFAWKSDINMFGSFRNACWYSWQKQIESVQLMEAFEEVEWVFPGHGKWGRVSAKQFPEIIRESVKWMINVK